MTARDWAQVMSNVGIAALFVVILWMLFHVAEQLGTIVTLLSRIFVVPGGCGAA